MGEIDTPRKEYSRGGGLLREKEWKREDQFLGIGSAEERSRERETEGEVKRDGAKTEKERGRGEGEGGRGGEGERERWQDGANTLLPLQRCSGKREPERAELAS